MTALLLCLYMRKSFLLGLSTSLVLLSSCSLFQKKVSMDAFIQQGKMAPKHNYKKAAFSCNVKTTYESKKSSKSYKGQYVYYPQDDIWELDLSYENNYYDGLHYVFENMVFVAEHEYDDLPEGSNIVFYTNPFKIHIEQKYNINKYYDGVLKRDYEFNKYGLLTKLSINDKKTSSSKYDSESTYKANTTIKYSK